MSSILNEIIDISLIDPHPKNYKYHPKSQLDQLEDSYEEFDQYRSVVVWARPTGRYTQVAGHGVVAALVRLGVEKVRADILPESTPASKIEAILAADNLLPRGGQDNLALLNQILHEQLQTGRDAGALGLTKQETDKLLHSILASQKTDFLKDVLTPSPVPSSFPLPATEPDLARPIPEQQAFPVSAGAADSEWLPMNLTISQQERRSILAAISQAKREWPAVRTQAEAIVEICKKYVQEGA